MNIFDLKEYIKISLSSKNMELKLILAGQILSKKNKTLSSAESCTGGLISSMLTDIPGSSAFIKSNFVTYSNEAKHKYLGVSEDTLFSYGAVSEETAKEMIKGLLQETASDYGIAITGIAGPSGGSIQKPVGLAYIGIGCKEKNKIIKYNVNSNLNRKIIKYLFAKKAINEFYDFLKENENV